MRVMLGKLKHPVQWKSMVITESLLNYHHIYLWIVYFPGDSTLNINPSAQIIMHSMCNTTIYWYRYNLTKWKAFSLVVLTELVIYYGITQHHFMFINISTERELEILQSLEDLDIQEDQNAVFMCEVSLDDVPGEWFKNGEKIKPTSTVKIRQEGYSSTRC